LAVPHPQKGDDSVRQQASFWIIPSDLDKVVSKIADLTAADDPMEIIVNNTPYIHLYNAMHNSQMRGDAPNEWFAMTEKNLWLFKCRNDWGFEPEDYSVYDCPVPDPEEHVVVRAWILQLKGDKDAVSYEGKEYQDGRKSGALHPAIGELKKSSSKDLMQKIREGVITGEMANLDNEHYLSIKNIQKQFSGGGGKYWTHQIQVRKHDLVLDKDNVIEEYCPFGQPQKVGGSERPPVLNIMTTKDQLKLLTQLYGPEVMDYAFSDTDFESHLPDGVKGAFAKFQDLDISWFDLMQKRVANVFDKYRKKSKEKGGEVPKTSSEAPGIAKTEEFDEDEAMDDLEKKVAKAEEEAEGDPSEPETPFNGDASAGDEPKEEKEDFDVADDMFGIPMDFA